MADNICWIKDELFPGRRVLVWGHSGHTRKMGSKTDAALSMCERFTSKNSRVYYSVGMFAYGGRGAWNNRKEYDLAIPPENSMEARIHAEEGAVFTDLHDLSERGETWVDNSCFALSWGTELEQLVPREQFDGVLVASRVRPPTYLE
jgi:erythromycin esterase